MEESAKLPCTTSKMITYIPMASVSTILKHIISKQDMYQLNSQNIVLLRTCRNIASLMDLATSEMKVQNEVPLPELARISANKNLL